MDKLGIAVVGLGMGAAHLRNAEQHPSARLFGLCDLNQDLLGRFAAEMSVPLATTDYDEILASPDVQIVSITTPDHLHHPQTLAALDAGKHVLVEKPMACTVAECEEMVQRAREKHLKLMVGHICRFYDFFAQVKAWSDEGLLGRPFYVETSYVHNYRHVSPGAGNWRNDPQKRHPMVGGGCHAVDLARWLAGDVAEVHAYANHYNMPEWQWPDHFLANCKFAGGMVGRVMMAGGAPRPYNIECELWGTEGVVAGDNTSDEALLSLTRTSDRRWARFPKDPMAKAIANQIAHFVDCVINDQTPLIDGVDGAKTVATCWAVQESLDTGLPVAVRNDF